MNNEKNMNPRVFGCVVLVYIFLFPQGLVLYFLNPLAGWKSREKLVYGLQRLCTGILFLVEIPDLKCKIENITNIEVYSK